MVESAQEFRGGAVRITIENVAKVFGVAVGVIAVFLLVCFLVGSCVDRCSRNEGDAHREPVQQDIPFKK